MQKKLVSDNPDIDFAFVKASASDRKINDRIMDAIIKKYKPKTKERAGLILKPQAMSFSNSEFLGEDVGLEKMSKDLYELSN